MGRESLNFLVLCTGNSARSILGEVLINELGRGRCSASSAGSHPAGRVNPGAIDVLERHGHPIDGLESKSWDRYAGTDAPAFDIVITVCDNAAGESCPVWNGAPVRVHWGIADPAAAPEDQRREAFDRAYRQLRRRIENMLEVPLEDMDMRGRADALHRIHDAVRAEESSGA